MSETPTTLHQTDPSLISGSTVNPQELSLERIHMLTEASEDLSKNMPQFMGMTLFGSTSRGEARPDSDVDIFVFLDSTRTPDAKDMHSQHLDNTYRIETGGRTGTVDFVPFIEFNDKQSDEVLKTVQSKGLEKVGLILLPLDDTIFEQTINELLHTAELWDSGDNSLGAQVPNNIRALFHVPISDTRLKAYIERTLTMLNDYPQGNTAWRMIRHQVIGFEHPKKEVQIPEDFRALGHRHIPESLDEATQTYIKA